MITLAEAWATTLMLARVLAFPLLVVVLVYAYHQIVKAPVVDDRPSADPRNEQMAREAVWDYENADSSFEGETPFKQDLIERGAE